jgi:hypothetical protein
MSSIIMVDHKILPNASRVKTFVLTIPDDRRLNRTKNALSIFFSLRANEGVHCFAFRHIWVMREHLVLMLMWSTEGVADSCQPPLR